MQLFPLLCSVFCKYLSQRADAQCLSREVYLYFLWDEIKPDKSQNLGLGNSFHWKILVAMILLYFLQDRYYFKPNTLYILSPYTIPFIPLCFILPSPAYLSLNLFPYFTKFLWWHHWVHSHVLHGKWAEVSYEHFVLLQLEDTALLFQTQPLRGFFSFKAAPFQDPWP